jgi:hypothetical protein
MAREHRSWGCDRIAGAVANLGYRISDQTVGTMLKRHDIPPAPERKKTMTWWEFIRIHMAVLGATACFSSAVWSSLSLLVASILCFIPYGLCSASPGTACTTAWTAGAMTGSPASVTASISSAHGRAETMARQRRVRLSVYAMCIGYLLGG